jgi:hypothetical protein
MGNTSKADEGHIISISLSNGRRKRFTGGDVSKQQEEE